MILRIRISINLADGQIDPNATPHALKQEYGVAIERSIAAAFPERLAIDTVKVTRVNIAPASEPVEDAA